MSLTIQELVARVKQDITEVSADDVHARLGDQAQVLIDVREPDEFGDGHLSSAINIPRGIIEFKLDPTNPNGMPDLYDKTLDIVLYCRTGGRSALAAQNLMALGYQSVVSMAGGIEGWKASGKEVVK